MAQTTGNEREVRFRDGLGLRVPGADQSGDAVEQLRLTPELTAQESAIRDRVGHLVDFRDVKFVRLRDVDRLKTGLKELVVTYDAIEGERLSTILADATTLPLTIEVDVAMQVVRDLLTGIGILHDSRKVTHGAIAPERLLYTQHHRLIIVDHGLGLALSKLNQPRKRLWDQYRVAVPQANRSVFDERTDVIQIGLVALAMLLGRPLADDDYPGDLKRLVLSVKEHSSNQAVRPLSPGLRQWLERALPVDAERAYKTVREAQHAFERMVSKGRYAPTAAAVTACLTLHREKVRAAAEADSSEAPRLLVDGSFNDLLHVEAVPFEPGREGPLFELSSPPLAPVEPMALEMVPAGTPLLDTLPLETTTFGTTPFERLPLDLPQEFAALPDEASLGHAPLEISDAEERPSARASEERRHDLVSNGAAAIDLPAPAARVEAASANGTGVVETRAAAPQAPDDVSFFEWDASLIDAVPAWARGTAHLGQDESAGREMPQGIGAAQFEAETLIDHSPFGSGTQSTTTPPWHQRQPVAPSNAAPLSPGYGSAAHAVDPTAGVHRAPAALLVRRPTRFRINWARTVAASLIVALLEGAALAAAWWYVTPNEKGWLVVHTRPSAIEIAIDGVHRGRTPFAAPLAPGRHTIELRQGTATRLVPVEISVGVQTEQRITWEGAVKTGQARITSSPEGALVTIDGKRHGATPVVASGLAAGKHTVLVETSAGSVRATVIVAPGETTELEVPVYSGWVSVLAPVALDIFTRGRLIGTTEVEKLMLAPGTHTLELVNEELGYRGSQTVEVRPGATTAVSVVPKTDVTIEGPNGVELLVDGESAGELPIGKLSTLLGTREFVFRSSNQADRRQVVIVTKTTPLIVTY